jgi:hypothetical protein
MCGKDVYSMQVMCGRQVCKLCVQYASYAWQVKMCTVCKLCVAGKVVYSMQVRCGR